MESDLNEDAHEQEGGDRGRHDAARDLRHRGGIQELSREKEQLQWGHASSLGGDGGGNDGVGEGNSGDRRSQQREALREVEVVLPRKK